MQVSSYIFQSPYPSAIQVGRPNPQAETSSNEEPATQEVAQTDKKISESSSEYVAQSSAASSVNVAVSSTDSTVSDSLDTFSTLNTQLKAVEAFS